MLFQQELFLLPFYKIPNPAINVIKANIPDVESCKEGNFVMAIANLLKNYHEEVGIGVMKPYFVPKDTENGRTYPLYCVDSSQRFYIQSSELEAQYLFICIKNISKSVNTLSQFHNNMPPMSDYPCCDIKEAVSQGFDKPFLINTRQCQSFYPIDNIVCQHPYSQICPVSMKLLTGESVE